MGNEPSGQKTPVFLTVPPGSEKGAFSLPSTATRIDDKNVNLNDNTSIMSNSTLGFLLTEDDENDISIPPLPEKLCTGKAFECPYCHVLCSRRTSNKMAWERHVLRDLRPYVCTYEDCTEADQQYDSIKDWVSHEVNTHRDKKLQPTSPGEQSSNDRGLSQPPKLLAPNDTCRPECPICLEKNPSFVHIGDLNEDEIDDDWKEWDAKTPAGVAPIEKTRQEDVQRFEHALQQVNKSTRRELDMITFFAESELDNALLYQGESNNDGPASVTRQAGSPVPITLSGGNQTYTNLSFYVQIDPLVPNYQEQPIRHGPTDYWAPPNIRTGYTRGNGMLFRWMGGSISPVTAKDPIHRAVIKFTVLLPSSRKTRIRLIC